MNEAEIRELLALVSSGELSIEEALLRVKSGPFRVSETEDMTLDHHRLLRHGLCEVIYGESKTVEQILNIARTMDDSQHPVLITRIDEDKGNALHREFPKGRLNPDARTFILNSPEPKKPDDREQFVAIVSAGTSDRPVVEEAAEVCIASEIAFQKVSDVGVAGIHRLYGKLDILNQATAIVVVAGMEGALPSVVAGMVGKPIFAVPTSVGYGANLGGLSALFTMLNSCASGLAVVNIDSGFSAAYSACKVVREVQSVVRNATGK